MIGFQRANLDTLSQACYTAPNAKEAVNGKSRRQSGAQRAGDRCEPGASAGVEWAREPRSERGATCQ